jgi:hypothetical protein
LIKEQTKLEVYKSYDLVGRMKKQTISLNKTNKIRGLKKKGRFTLKCKCKRTEKGSLI